MHVHLVHRFAGTYSEFNEMAIQFGYVTMFASVAPWAPFFCMLNNMAERRTDAYKMLYGRRRPVYAGAESIGTWSVITPGVLLYQTGALL